MRFLFFILFINFMLSCADNPNFSDVPTLRFDGFSKNEMIQGRSMEDSLIIHLYFTDGDGDFGSVSNETNITIIDKRTGVTKDIFKAPMIPLQGANNGVSGTIALKIFTTCCIFPAATGIPPCERPTQFPDNDLILDITIKDRAGNVSNTVTTDAIKLKCI